MKSIVNFMDILLKAGNGSAKLDHLLTHRKLDNRYEYVMQEWDKTRIVGNTELEKLKNKVKVKLIYLNIKSALRDTLGENASVDQEIDREIIRKIIEQKEYITREEAIITTSSEKHNAYRDLGSFRQTPLEQISKNYMKQLKKLEEDVDAMIQEENYNQDEINKLQVVEMIMDSSYEQLCDPEGKLKIDEKFLINFNPNQEKLFIPGNFADISYMPVKGQRDSSIQMANFQGDKIKITKTGDVGFGRFRQKDGKVTYRDPYCLEEYTIVKRYADPKLRARRKELAEREDSLTQWDENEHGEVFRIYTNFDMNLILNPNVDVEYLKYIVNTLLSTYNMEEALKHNGGYVGNISLSKDNNYIVKHDTDKLCLACELADARKKQAIGDEAKLLRTDTAIQRHRFKGEGR